MNQKKDQRKLSSKLTNMKFMKRKENRITRKRIEQEREKEQDAHYWVLEHGANACLVDDLPSTPSFKTGRRSYGGFNKVVEKILCGVKAELNGCTSEQQFRRDRNMARNFQSLTGNSRSYKSSNYPNPFDGNKSRPVTPKRERPKPKPSGDDFTPRKRRKSQPTKPNTAQGSEGNSTYAIHPDRLNVVQKMCREINEEDDVNEDRDQNVDNDSWDDGSEEEGTNDGEAEEPKIRTNAISFLSQLGGNQFQPPPMEEEIEEPVDEEKQRTKLENTTGQRMLPKALSDLFGDDYGDLFADGM